MALDGDPLRSKFQSYYVQDPKIALAACRNCLWFVPGPSPKRGKCRLVSPAQPPDAGFISASATCNLWNAGPARILLEDALRGRGEGERGIAPNNARILVEKLVVHGEHDVPP